MVSKLVCLKAKLQCTAAVLMVVILYRTFLMSIMTYIPLPSLMLCIGEGVCSLQCKEWFVAC